jgi:RNA polymerase sigma-70 factor (ECF subfamily)
LTSEGLRKALLKLNDEQRDVIILRFVAGMPIAEVAQSLNKSEDAVKGLQRRALISLRGILAGWEASDAQL